jgi:putative membrane-bound dehydrogenase-like protein
MRDVCLLALIVAACGCHGGLLSAAEPRVLDDRLKLELFAEHPQLVTPTGIDVDHRGRVWVIESNTHFPPEGYTGHATDRVLVLEDTDHAGPADRISVFADGLKHGMSVAVQPVWLEEPAPAGQRGSTGRQSTPPLSVFLATRSEILLLRDSDGDLKADERRQLVHLDTKGDYPHNGLAGFAFDPLGWMYFGFGENLGESYRIIGSDGTTFSGGGEGGNLYRCRPDGSQLERWATGFWNPHASCFDAFGRLFTVDNDPDSRPPCRLLHIIPGGDYGYRFRNGRKGTHPFTSWNGELPGTLPMVSGTGEAPSGIICYEAEGFPEDYQGTLLIGSWGDHRIDKFVLHSKRMSFTSQPEPIVQGNEEFRPVGLALAPDGSVFFSDWVLRDYKLHGRGRVWKLSARQPARQPDPFAKDAPAASAAALQQTLSTSRSLPARRLAARALARSDDGQQHLKQVLNDSSLPVRGRLESLWALLASPNVHPVDLFGTPEQPAAFVVEKGMVADIARRMVRDQRMSQVDWVADKEQETSPTPWDDPFRLADAITDLTRFAHSDALIDGMGSSVFVSDHFRKPTTDWERLATLLASRRREPLGNSAILRLGLTDDSAMVRRAAVQWVGEERRGECRWLVEALLHDARTTPDLLCACLASLSLLDGVPPSEFEKTPPAQYALAIVADERRPPTLRATALRLIAPTLPELKTEWLIRLAQSPDKTLQIEAIRTLQQSPRREAMPLLLAFAGDARNDVALRADCLSALCALVPHEQPLPPEVQTLLVHFARGAIPGTASADVTVLQLEAIRALRSRATEGSLIRAALSELRRAAGPDTPLREALDLALEGQSTFDPRTLSVDAVDTQPPQPDSGRRVFFAPQGPMCARCHTVHGRGGKVGPDLSAIGRTMDRQKLITSILDPSREVAPYYLTWTISTTDGRVLTGMVVSENGGGDLELGDQQGNIVRIPRKDIEERVPAQVSVMPQNLHQRMTRQEFLDLLSFLESLK